jgi:hypothetical protein
MPAASDPDLDAILARERSLLTEPVRSDPEAVGRLLHPEFREFGASGRVWNADEVGAAVTAHPAVAADGAIRVEHLEAARLADDVVLVTYDATRDGRLTHRSSLWLRAETGWLMRFHQGTSSTAADDV